MNAQSEYSPPVEWASAADCFVLAFGANVESGHILRLLLVELRTRGIIQPSLSVDPHREPSSTNLWTIAPHIDAPLHGSLSILRDRFVAASQRSPSGTVDLIPFLHPMLDKHISILESLILPDLQHQHLYDCLTCRRFWIFRSHEWRLTSEGETRSFQLQRLLMDGQREFSYWSRYEPERAWQFLGESGPAALTLTSLYPFMERFGTQIHDTGSQPNLFALPESAPNLTTWAGLWRDDQAIYESIARAQHQKVVPISTPSFLPEPSNSQMQR